MVRLFDKTNEFNYMAKFDFNFTLLFQFFFEIHLSKMNKLLFFIEMKFCYYHFKNHS